MGFRHWLREKWYEHLEELDTFGQKCDYDVKYYFNKYKYWLKRQYRYEHGKTFCN